MKKKRIATWLAVVAILTSGITILDMTSGPAKAWATPNENGADSSGSTQVNDQLPETSYEQITITESGWIEYPSVLEQVEIDDSSISLTELNIRGTKTENGCDFDNVITPDQLGVSSDAQVYISEVGFNPGSCESKLVAAEVTAEQLALIDQVSGANQPGYDAPESHIDTHTDPLRVNPSAPRTRVGIFGYSKTLQAMVQDPVHLTTTSTTTSLTWTTQYGIVKSYSVDHGYTWMTPTGWSRTSYSEPTGIIGNWSSVYGNTTASYQNTAFCFAVGRISRALAEAVGGWGTTYAYHSSTYIEGRGNGSWALNHRASKSGGCNLMLHTDYAVS